MFGSVTRQNICQPLAPSTRAASSSVAALRLHERNQLARDERKRHKRRRQHDARHGKDDFDVVIASARSKPALARQRAARKSIPQSPAKRKTAGQSA